MDDAGTWALIHSERAALADTLAELTPEQWAQASLCGYWSVQVAAGHVVVGAEQSTPNFVKGMASSGFRFNHMVDRDARRAGAEAPDRIVERLRARLTSTNRPPAPVAAMLGEVVVHGLDIRQPLGLPSKVDPDALIACLDMYKVANFPVGAKRRVAGLGIRATDLDWSSGDGPEVTGPADALLLAICGRPAGLAELSGDGAAALGSRMA